MRKSILALLAAVSVSRADSIAPQTHTFQIYSAPLVDHVVLSGQRPNDLMGHTLADSPLITDADILSYDFERHALTLKPEAIARLPRPKASGNPFIVMVDGQRIYLGAFVTPASSMSFAVPTITVNGWVPNTNRSEPVNFSLEDLSSMVIRTWPDARSDESSRGGMLDAALATNVLVIDRAYPQASFGKGYDPRSDHRIKHALASLHKLSASEATRDQEFTKKMREIMLECQAVRKGMTRAELLKVFTTEGGLSTARERTYVHRNCPYVKVKVEFESAQAGQGAVEERSTDVIRRISEPFLQGGIMD